MLRALLSSTRQIVPAHAFGETSRRCWRCRRWSSCSGCLILRDDPGRRVGGRRGRTRPSVRWASPFPGDHHINGVRHRPGLVGLDAAWCAISTPGHGVRAADFCAPDAAHPAVSMRAAIKRAANYLDAFCPALAAEVRSLRVLRGDIVYRPTGRCDVVA